MPSKQSNDDTAVIRLDLSEFYQQTAKIAELPQYTAEALSIAGEGKEVMLTGAAPVWMYLSLAHALHGKVRKLSYDSPVTGEIEIFDHNPF